MKFKFLSPLVFAAVLPLMAGRSLATDEDYGDFSKFATASSHVEPKLHLGATVDADNKDSSNGGGLLGGLGGLLEDVLGLLFTPNTTATSDDATGDPDEDGVTVPPLIAQGGTVTIPITLLNNTGKTAYLNAWVDFDNNGTLNDVIYTTAGGEKVTNQIALASSATPKTQNITFTVPMTASPGTGRGMRFRITDTSNPGPTGAKGDGEVEDYVINITTPGFTYGIGEHSVYEINVLSGSGTKMFDMAFPGTGNALAFHSGLGSDGVLIYGTGEEGDLRLGVWDRTSGANNIAGDLASYGMGSNKVLRAAACYGGYFWTIVDDTDDLWKITITGTSGNYRITAATKVADIWGNARGHSFGDFDIRPDGTMLAIALNSSTSRPEYFTANVTASPVVATLKGTPPIGQNAVAFGLDGKFYGGLGLYGDNEDWYVIDQSNGNILSTTPSSSIHDIADMTNAVAFSAPAGNPMQDYGDFSKFATAGSLRTNNLRLGGTVDGESSPQSNTTATADDNAGADDEDGVVMPPTMSRGEVVTLPVTVYNNSGASAYLSAWMDFDNSGTLSDVLYTTTGGERLTSQITIPTSATPVTKYISFTVPLTASLGTNRGLRFRLNSIGGQGPTGTSGNGEVEDYAVTVDSMRLTATMQVRTEGSATWSNAITAEAGSNVEYRLVLTNAGNVTLKDPLAENLLPAIGDTGTTSTAARNSAWPMLLTGPATVPAGVVVTYSLVQNPRRAEMLSPDPDGSLPPQWGALPEFPVKVRAIKFDGAGLTLAAGATLTMTWKTTLPWDAAANTSCYNSAGATAVRADLNTQVTPVESNKPSVQAVPATGQFYGDTVWDDTDGDGIQDAGENGVNDVRVDFYRDNGDGIADPATDTLVSTTLTSTLNGKAGGYRFGRFAAGSYFAVISPPDTWSFSLSGQGSSAAADSDAKTIIQNGRRIGIMPVTQITANESDMSWDAGLKNRSDIPAVWAIAESTGGRRMLGGKFTKSHGVSRRNIVRVFANGSVDTTFDPGTGFDDTVRSVAIRNDGKIWVGGNFTSYNGNASVGVALLSDTGVWDSSPAQPNTSSVNWVGTSGTSLYLAGSFTKVGSTTCGNIARLTATGAVDTAFNQGAGSNGPIYGGAVQTDGSLIIAGAFSTFNGTARKGVAKIKANGTLDTGFDPLAGPSGDVFSVKLIEDGRMVLTGNFVSFAGVECNGAVRLNANGTVDTTMNKSSLNVNTISTSN
ncbi:MAG TPA: GEVED domain-containing protein [Verrucomicrobiales bacterium]|nr:GEVED domain-containing protein [Verrucomicrobiales bacterium]